MILDMLAWGDALVAGVRGSDSAEGAWLSAIHGRLDSLADCKCTHLMKEGTTDERFDAAGIEWFWFTATAGWSTPKTVRRDDTSARGA